MNVNIVFIIKYIWINIFLLNMFINLLNINICIIILKIELIVIIVVIFFGEKLNLWFENKLNIVLYVDNLNVSINMIINVIVYIGCNDFFKLLIKFDFFVLEEIFVSFFFVNGFFKIKIEIIYVIKVIVVVMKNGICILYFVINLLILGFIMNLVLIVVDKYFIVFGCFWIDVIFVIYVVILGIIKVVLILFNIFVI